MEKKKLKKLSLQKEEVINLYDYEMNSIKGGTSPLTNTGPITTIYSIVTYVIDEIKDYYESQNRTNTNQQTNTSGKTSDAYINTICSLPEVEVICS